MTYHIGDVLAYIKPRGITGADLHKPVWHALTVQPGREAAARDMLGAHGVHAQYPVREVKHFNRGKKIVRKLPVITRVVYAQFKSQPNWDIMRNRRLITGVYSVNGWPIEIPYDIVRAVMGLPTVAEALEEARRELLRVREGDRAEITEGPLSGMVVDVTRVASGRVWWETMTGVKGESEDRALERKSE